MGNDSYSSFLLKKASTELTLFLSRTVTDLGLYDGGQATGRSGGFGPLRLARVTGSTHGNF